MDDCPICRGPCKGPHTWKDIVGDAPVFIVQEGDPVKFCACGQHKIQEGPMLWRAILSEDGVEHTLDRCFITGPKQ